MNTKNLEVTDGVVARRLAELYSDFAACRRQGAEHAADYLRIRERIRRSYHSHAGYAFATEAAVPPACRPVLAGFRDPPQLLLVPERRLTDVNLRGYYDPGADTICFNPDGLRRQHDIQFPDGCPLRAAFEREDPERRAVRVFFHELIHSTGALHRLSRASMIGSTGGSREGSLESIVEESIAEAGAMILSGKVGMMDADQSTVAGCYINSFICALGVAGERVMPLVRQEAELAAEYILSGGVRRAA